MINLSDMSYIENNHLSAEALAISARALNQDILDSLPPAVQEHIATCKFCKKEIFAISETIRHIDKNSKLGRVIRLPGKGASLKTTRLLFIAGSVAAVVVFLGLWILIKSTPLVDRVEAYQPPEKNNTSIIEKAVEINDQVTVNTKMNSPHRPPEAEKQLALINTERQGEMFKESGFFENFIQSAYRSSNDLKVEPLNNEVFKIDQPIDFKFHTSLPGPVSLFIFNNKGKKVFTATDIQQESFCMSTSLEPGLYYWKLISNSNLLYTGKFFVQ
jgi:hypothetical protein